MQAEQSLRDDIAAIAAIPFLPALLEVVCKATGMGFAAVARVTEDRWIAGAVRDEIQFGLIPGGELPVKTTICDEIRHSQTPVIIDHVSYNAAYRDHHTPALYGFESYISFPILRNDGSFFGTLCAIDPRPASLDTPPIIELFQTLASLLAYYLDGLQTLSDDKVARAEWYVQVELENTIRDLTTDDTSFRHEKAMILAMKINQLVLALEPSSAFLA